MEGAALVMDFDGTILDTEEPVYRSWVELWEEHGQDLVRAEWQAIIGTDGSFDPWVSLERRIGRPLDPALAERRRARRDELQAAHEMRPGVVEWLAAADELGVPVGVASSSPAAWVEAHLARLGIRERFRSLVCCDVEVPAKPDPTSYRLVCEQLGADPTRSVAVEDSPHGIAAAVGAGLFTVAVPHALTADLDLSAADVIVPSLEALTLPEALTAAGARPC